MDAPTILLIESMRANGTSFASALGKRYQVVTAYSGKQGLTLAKNCAPQVIVLDAVSMRTSGDRLCATLRGDLASTPIIHIRPELKPAEKPTSPADVLLYQPFTARKLVNAIERFLRSKNDEIVSYGPFTMNTVRRVLTVNGAESQLTPKLALLVETFLRNPEETLDRKTLMEQIWKTDYLGDTRTLDVHIRWMRQAIGDDPKKQMYLKTVRGVGYRLDANGNS